MVGMQSDVHFSSARQAMVDGLIRPANVTNDWLVSAMSVVDRTEFVAKSHHGVVYSDAELPSAPNGERQLMSPLTLAKLLQSSQPRADDNCLIIGSASGYSVALLADQVGAIVALEDNVMLHEYATDCLARLEYANVIFLHGDLTKGCKKHGPYDVILIEGAVEEIPLALKKQIAAGGRLVCVEIGKDGVHRGVCYCKFGSTIDRLHLFDLAAPPLEAFHRAEIFTF